MKKCFACIMLCLLLPGCSAAAEEPAPETSSPSEIFTASPTPDDPQPSSAKILSMWEGKWSCYGTVDAELTIINVTELSFDLSFSVHSSIPTAQSISES